MKKTQKRCFGVLGLSAVVAMTAVAFALPSPDASTISTMTDTLNVRVVSDTPNVDITGIESGEEFVIPRQSARVTYEHVNTVKVTLAYTDLEGNESSFVLVDDIVDFHPGQYDFNFNFDEPQYGYGNYILTVVGEGEDGVKDQDIIEFTYLPFIATLDEQDDKTYVDLEYDNDATLGNIKEFILNVYDKDGNIVSGLSPISLLAPGTRVEVPFGNYDLAAGEYTIRVTAKDSSGTIPYTQDLEKDIADIPVPSADTPDTGGFFRNIGISQSDFLISGLIIFFVIGVCGILVVSRKSKKA